MMKGLTFNTNTKNNEVWLTPPYIIKALGPFDLDPCFSENRPWDTAKHHYCLPTDGLFQPWFGRIWLNPPYGNKTFKWIKKLSEHPEGGIALIFARTETKGFHEFIWNKADAVFFFKGRLKFHLINGDLMGVANAPSCLIAYKQYNVDSIKNAIEQNKIIGKLVYL